MRHLNYLVIALVFAFVAKQNEAQEPLSEPSKFPFDYAFAEHYFPELEPILLSVEKSAIKFEEIRAQLEAEEEAVKAARGLTLPRVKFAANITRRQDIRESETTTEITPFNQATITQPLYHWGALEARQSIAKLGREIAGLGTVETHRVLLRTIREYFLNIMFQMQVIEIRQKNLEETKQLVERIRIDVDGGRKSEIDLRDGELRLAEAELEITSNQQILEHQKNLFKIVSGQPFPEPKQSLQEELSKDDISVNSSEAQMMDAQLSAPEPFDYLRKIKQLEIEEEQYRIIRSSTRPKVSLAVRYQFDQVGSRNEDRQLFDTALVIDWNIFDGFQTKHNKLRSKAKQRELRASSNLIQIQKANDYDNRLKNLELAATRLSIFEQRIELTEALTQAERIRYDSGIISISDLLEKEKRIREESVRYLGEKINYIQNLAWLASELGFDRLSPQLAN